MNDRLNQRKVWKVPPPPPLPNKEDRKPQRNLNLYNNSVTPSLVLELYFVNIAKRLPITYNDNRC